MIYMNISHLLPCIFIYTATLLTLLQPCVNSDQGFREQQCSHFDNHTFKAKQYTWEPFIKRMHLQLRDRECHVRTKINILNF